MHLFRHAVQAQHANLCTTPIPTRRTNATKKPNKPSIPHLPAFLEWGTRARSRSISHNANVRAIGKTLRTLSSFQRTIQIVHSNEGKTKIHFVLLNRFPLDGGKFLLCPYRSPRTEAVEGLRAFTFADALCPCAIHGNHTIRCNSYSVTLRPKVGHDLGKRHREAFRHLGEMINPHLAEFLQKNLL